MQLILFFLKNFANVLIELLQFCKVLNICFNRVQKHVVNDVIEKRFISKLELLRFFDLESIGDDVTNSKQLIFCKAKIRQLGIKVASYLCSLSERGGIFFHNFSQ